MAVTQDSALVGWGVLGEMVLGRYSEYSPETSGGGGASVLRTQSFPSMPVSLVQFEVGFDIRGRVIKHA
jgi:hypothetical protein